MDLNVKGKSLHRKFSHGKSEPRTLLEPTSEQARKIGLLCPTMSAIDHSLDSCVFLNRLPNKQSRLQLEKMVQFCLLEFKIP